MIRFCYFQCWSLFCEASPFSSVLFVHRGCSTMTSSSYLWNVMQLFCSCRWYLIIVILRWRSKRSAYSRPTVLLMLLICETVAHCCSVFTLKCPLVDTSRWYFFWVINLVCGQFDIKTFAAYSPFCSLGFGDLLTFSGNPQGRRRGSLPWHFQQFLIQPSGSYITQRSRPAHRALSECSYGQSRPPVDRRELKLTAHHWFVLPYRT